jgi:hypothetical protein
VIGHQNSRTLRRQVTQGLDVKPACDAKRAAHRSIHKQFKQRHDSSTWIRVRIGSARDKSGVIECGDGQDKVFVLV